MNTVTIKQDNPEDSTGRPKATPSARAVVEPALAVVKSRRVPLLERPAVREAVASWVRVLFPCAVGMVLFIGVWTVIAQNSPDCRPRQDLASAVEVFSDPFYGKPNDQGIGWNVLNSLSRVGVGFGLAALIGCRWAS